jgi:hypothetical protein
MFDLELTPKSKEEGGPLHIFAEKSFQDSIIKFHKDNQGNSSYDLAKNMLQ